MGVRVLPRQMAVLATASAALATTADWDNGDPSAAYQDVTTSTGPAWPTTRAYPRTPRTASAPASQ